MSTARPFAYNTGPSISGATQVGQLAIGVENINYSEGAGGVRWWNGPDEDLGYVIGFPQSGGTQPTPEVPTEFAFVQFWRSVDKTEESFLNLSNYISDFSQNFTGATDAVSWLNANGYWTSYIPSRPYNDLQTIAEYLRGFMSEFRNPDFYAYQLDGDGYEIDDGGGDMYDGGNISSPWVISNTEYISTNGYSEVDYPFAIDYTNSASTATLDTSFGYISLGYQQFTGVQSLTYLPLTVLGSRDNETFGPNLPVGFQTGGNSGADGGGALASGYIYSGSVISGFTVYSFYRETYNAGDPSHCDLYILLGHPNWDSTFGNVSAFAQPVNQGGCGGYLYTSGTGTKNILSIKTLLSKNSGQLVTSAECETVVNNFIRRIKEAVNF